LAGEGRKGERRGKEILHPDCLLGQRPRDRDLRQNGRGRGGEETKTHPKKIFSYFRKKKKEKERKKKGGKYFLTQTQKEGKGKKEIGGKAFFTA